MDPYAYVGNNPEGRTDPTGHCWPLCTMLIGAVIGAAVSVVATVVTSAIQGKAPTGGELLQAAAVGAVTGAISGLVGPEAGPLAHVAVGALANGAGQMVGNLMAGKPLMSGVGEAVVTGALTGGLVEGAGALLKGVGSKVLSSVEEDTASHLNLEGTTCSFTPQTVVATQHGKQPIGKVQVGERVLAYNPKTGKMELEPILHVWIHNDNDLIDLTLTTTTKGPDGKVAKTSELIHTNQKHPFFTLERGFLPVGQIKLGMHVLRADGRIGVVTGWQVVPGSKTMYNLEVAQDHTFTVGDGQWVVHNCEPNVMEGTTTQDLYRQGGINAGPKLGYAREGSEAFGGIVSPGKGTSLWASIFKGEKPQGWWKLPVGSNIPEGYRFVSTGIIDGIEHWEFRPIQEVTVQAFEEAANSITKWSWMGKF